METLFDLMTSSHTFTVAVVSLGLVDIVVLGLVVVVVVVVVEVDEVDVVVVVVASILHWSSANNHSCRNNLLGELNLKIIGK